MKLKITQTESAGKKYWIAKDPEDGLGHYFGPFVNEAAARAFARPINSENWKESLRNAREDRRFWKAVAATAEKDLAA